MLSAGNAFTRTVAGGVPPARRQQTVTVRLAGALPAVPDECKFLASC